ncbi:hypothetical protein MWU59_00480 [Flavobacteriaceae bacterium F08102]|nr:hypothetical protein [Flavobacteriaceae bacterium F08102]
MKNSLILLLICCISACGDTEDGNPFLPNVAVNQTVYLSNPSNNALLFTGGYVEIGGGIKGIVIYRGAGDQFYAYDLACPHLTPNECSKMVIEDAFYMVCTCDETKFALGLGGAPQSGTKYAAKQYKVTKSGETLLINNF